MNIVPLLPLQSFQNLCSLPKHIQSKPGGQDAATFYLSFLSSVSPDNQVVQKEKRHYYSKMRAKSGDSTTKGPKANRKQQGIT